MKKHRTSTTENDGTCSIDTRWGIYSQRRIAQERNMSFVGSACAIDDVTSSKWISPFVDSQKQKVDSST